MRHMDAVVAARWLFGEQATSFRLLGIGQAFVFAGDRVTNGPEPLYVKTSANGWYTDIVGRKFRTGGGSAVLPVTGVALPRLPRDPDAYAIKESELE